MYLYQACESLSPYRLDYYKVLLSLRLVAMLSKYFTTGLKYKFEQQFTIWGQ
jgi:hypothetical protein